MQFKAGNKVIFDETKGEVRFGPFKSAGSPEAYLVEWLEGINEGRCSVVWSQDISPIPSFKVGQKVNFSYDPEVVEVVAGPFPTGGNNLWIVKDAGGDHYCSGEDYLIPVVE